MSIKLSFDLLTLEIFYQEVYASLINSIIEKIYQIGNTEVFINLYSPSLGRTNLILSVHPQLYRIQLTKKDFPYPMKPPSFAMLLRKHLEGARLWDMNLVPQERIIEFRWKRSLDEDKKLVLELMGKYSNLILLNENNIIIDSIKHVTSEISRFREILPGISYIYPPKTQKFSLIDLKDENLEEIFKKAIPLKDLLLREISHMNPQIVKEILGELSNKTPSMLTEDEESILKERIFQYKERVIKKDFKFIVYLINNEPIAYSLFPLKEYEHLEKREFEKLHKAIDFIYSYAFEKILFDQEKKKLSDVVKNNIKKVEDKIREFETQIKEGEEAETFRIKGEALLLNQKKVRKGIEEVILPNPYNQEEFLEIALDPSLSSIENAQKYFKKYKKLKKGISILKDQKERLEEELYYLHSLDYSIDNADSLMGLREIAEELEKEGYIRERKEKEKRKEKKLEPHKFLSSDGFEIYVGKNNKQNEYITFHLANPEDIWLHARGI
ncbi:MAG TPA: NFACT family protein, partial [Dictyoglomaceae bacterium]|nr:NFACT family protein [Dictyoglomaceae bacterium]